MSKARESNKKEICGKCGSKEFNISEDPAQKRYCGQKGCNNIWGPMTKEEIEVIAASRDIAKLRAENKELRSEVDSLKKNSEMFS